MESKTDVKYSQVHEHHAHCFPKVFNFDKVTEEINDVESKVALTFNLTLDQEGVCDDSKVFIAISSQNTPVLVYPLDPEDVNKANLPEGFVFTLVLSATSTYTATVNYTDSNVDPSTPTPKIVL
jgi:hypothetical protein